MATRPQLQNISWSDVRNIQTWYMNNHADLVQARKTDRIPVMDQLNIFARFCDLVVGKAKAEGAADPMAHLIKILEANPSWMARQMRTPTEELEKLYTPVPLDMKKAAAANSSVDGDDSDADTQGSGTNSQSGDGDDDTQDDSQGQDSQGDSQDGDSQDGDSQDGDSQDGDSQDGDSQDGDSQTQGQGVQVQGDGDGSQDDGDSQDGDSQGDDAQDGAQDNDAPTSAFRDELHKDIALQFEKGERSLINIIGPAGSGKTYGVREEAEIFGAKIFLQTAVKRDTELFGKTGLEVVDGASKTVFKPSKLVQGLRYANEHPDERVIIVQDEFDVMPNPVKAPLFSLLNHPYVLEVDGEDIYMPMNCVFIAISNTAGHGGNDMHPDRELVDVAALDRFDFYVFAGFEHDTALKIAKNDTALVDFLEDWNNSVYESGNLRYLATYRSIEHAYKTQKAGHPLTKFVPTLTKGGSEADARQIYEGLKNHRGRYPQAVKAYLDNIPREACFL